MAVLFLLSFPVRAEDSLDIYRRALGSSLEKGLLDYARSRILHELDQRLPIPKERADMDRLPPVGIYLSLMRGQEVRACVGGFSPRASSLKRAIGRLAGEVVYHDIRKRPLSLEEMPALRLVISFVGPTREIRDPHSIDFSEQGLCITQEERRIVLLPGETKTLDYGIRTLIARNNLDPGRPIRFSSFQVVAFDERRH